MANSSGPRSLASKVTTLEQMGEISRSIPSTTTSHVSAQGMLTAPVFVGSSDTLTQSIVVDRTVNSCPTSVRESVPIVPTMTALSRKKTEISDILTWTECFNSYISVITAFQPEKTRDLLTYMHGLNNVHG